MPNPTLAVDGLTSAGDVRRGALDIGDETVAANEASIASPVMPEAHYDPEQLDVYGWESSLWAKLKGYLSF